MIRYLLRRLGQTSRTDNPLLIGLNQSPVLSQLSFSKKSKKSQKPGKSGSTLHAELDGLLSLDETTKSMEKAISHLKNELANVRSGRATSGMLDHLKVQNPDGEFIPLRAFGTVTVKESRTLNISLFDSNSLSSVSQALQDSPLQLQVKAINDQELTVALPVPSKESLVAMIKIVNKEGENSKRTVRTARKLGLAEVKHLISEDDKKRGEKAVDALTEHYIHQIDELCTLKVEDLGLRSCIRY
eukprot:g6436.t1